MTGNHPFSTTPQPEQPRLEQAHNRTDQALAAGGETVLQLGNEEDDVDAINGWLNMPV